MAEGGTCQDTERNRPSDAHSLSRDSRGRDSSGHGKKATEKRALTSWRRQREGFVRTRKETDRMTRTHFLEMAEGGTCQDTKETDQTTRAHSLETAEEGTCQDREINRLSDAHSLPGDGRRRDLSGHRWKPTQRRALTSWRRQREGLVRTRKETD